MVTLPAYLHQRGKLGMAIGTSANTLPGPGPPNTGSPATNTEIIIFWEKARNISPFIKTKCPLTWQLLPGSSLVVRAPSSSFQALPGSAVPPRHPWVLHTRLHSA